MPYYETSQEWLRQSQLLLDARPSTTRITTKYNISDPRLRRSSSSRKSKPTTTPSSTSSTTTTAAAPRGSITLKTYDPRSGIALKYRTTKAAEVSRLILSLGQLGTRMAGLPAGEGGDAVMADAAAGEEGTPVVEKGEPPAAGGAGGKAQGGGAGGGAGGGGGGKGKKKRGKK